MTQVCLYTAGPMTFKPQFNYPAFDALAYSLRSAGYAVVSPSELDNEEDRAAALASPDGDPTTYTGSSSWGDFLSRDVKLIADGGSAGIDGIVVLPGWNKSRGARLETFVGKAMCGLPVYTWDAAYEELTNVSYLALVKAWAAKDDISFHTEVESMVGTHV